MNDLEIVEILADLWLGLNSDYIRKTFDLPSDYSTCSFSKGYLVICEYGDILSGSIGSLVRSWWQVCDGLVEPVQSPRSQENKDSGKDDHRPIFNDDPTPILKIFVQDGQFVLGERYSSTLVCRRSGSISELKQGLSLDFFHLVWRSSPE